MMAVTLFITSVPFQTRTILFRRPPSRKSHSFYATMAPKTPIHSARVTLLRAGEAPESPTHVLYWMSTALRMEQNPSLQHATYLSNLHNVPLRVLHLLHDVMPDDSKMTERHALFQLESVRDVHKSFLGRNVPFTVLHSNDNTTIPIILAHAEGAAAVIADADYLRPGRKVRAELSEELNIPMHVVEANVVVPVLKASNKQEHAARTIRPKIHDLLAEYLERTSDIELEFQPEDAKAVSVEIDIGGEKSQKCCPISIVCDNDVESTLEKWPGLDHGAMRVKKLKGGEKKAKEMLDDFVNNKIVEYASGRNEPSLQLTSNMSPYLRLGCISPIEAALRVKEACKGKSKLKESCDSFLEELIVRRELSANACWFNDAYDDYDKIVPGFAQETLKDHESDERKYVYTYDELEAGVTHDEYWNAAQLELVATGKMHGYMRMYWAKQIIGWTDHPKEAMSHTLRLNNRWGLDAVDPNSYVGVAWCFGLHDHGWTERDVWGKVRYMNESGLKRKFDMSAYVKMVQKLVKSDGLPKHIVDLRKKRSENTKKQTTLSSTGTSSRATKRARRR